MRLTRSIVGKRPNEYVYFMCTIRFIQLEHCFSDVEVLALSVTQSVNADLCKC